MLRQTDGKTAKTDDKYREVYRQVEKTKTTNFCYTSQTQPVSQNTNKAAV